MLWTALYCTSAQCAVIFFQRLLVDAVNDFVVGCGFRVAGHLAVARPLSQEDGAKDLNRTQMNPLSFVRAR
jgi:hypothetical protein